MPSRTAFRIFRAAAVAVAAFLPMAHQASAAPTISVSRNPSEGAVGDAYAVTWRSEGAVRVGYDCKGAWNGAQPDISKDGLGLAGSVSGKYEASMKGATSCVWTATAQDGSQSVAGESFTVRDAVVATFKVTKVNSVPYDGTPVPVPSGTKSVVVEGVGGYRGGRIYSFIEGKVFANEPVADDGSWKLTLVSGLGGNAAFDFAKSGVMTFVVKTTGTADPEKTATYAFNVTGGGELTGMKCRSGDWYSETNLAAEFGKTVECTITSSDSGTRFMKSAGRTHRGDVDSVRQVLPQTDSQLPVRCSWGSCVGTYVADYHGYGKWIELWFENASGKSRQVTVSLSDPNSEEYREVNAKFDKAREEAAKAAAVEAAKVRVTGVTGSAKWDPSNAKVTVAEGAFFGIEGTGLPKSSLRLYRKAMSAEGISTGVAENGRWTTFNLGTRQYGSVFKPGSQTYVVETTAPDGKTVSTTEITIEIVAQGATSGNAADARTTSPTHSSGTPAAPVGNPSERNSGTRNPSPSNAMREQPESPASPEPNRNPFADKVSPKMRKSLDAFLGKLKSVAESEAGAADAEAYLAGVEKKLLTLGEKYRKARKTGLADAIGYLTHAVSAEKAGYADRRPMKGLRENY